MARALVVEDNDLTARLLDRSLRRAGHEVTRCITGSSALNSVAVGGYDVALLDFRLPDMTGQDLCVAIRESGNKLPVLMITAHDDVKRRIGCLHAGADDYLAKPFHVDEMVARVEALLRRARDFATKNLSKPQASLYADRSLLLANGVEVTLTEREVQLVATLAAAEGGVVRPENLLSNATAAAGQEGDAELVTTNLAQVMVHNLRKKLEAHAIQNFVLTVRGKGYRLGWDIEYPEHA